jgi:hypothetical protein
MCCVYIVREKDVIVLALYIVITEVLISDSVYQFLFNVMIEEYTEVIHVTVP